MPHSCYGYLRIAGLLNAIEEDKVEEYHAGHGRL
jgi:hypothetical protein